MPSPSSKSCFGFHIHADDHSPNGLRFELYANPPPLRVISFKGGAARVFVYRAVLEYFHENGLLEQIEEVGGSSAGCIAATFACIPYEDSAKRIEAIDSIMDSNMFDIMGESVGWDIYQTITYPLSLASSAISWIGNQLGYLGSTFSNDSPELSVIRLPLQLSARLIHTVGWLTSPSTHAGIYNYLIGGGIYHGTQTERQIRNQIQQGVQHAFHHLLNTVSDRELFIKHFMDINLIEVTDATIKVKPDVTFHHLYELSKIPGSQFKQCYITGARIDDKKLVVFNKDNTPHMPLYIACRIACAFPTLWQRVTYNGHTYFDGGVFNNSPVDLATNIKRSPQEELHGISDKLARLNIRVEYPNEHDYYLWRKKPEPGYISMLQGYVYQTLVKHLVLSGLDAFAAEEKSIHTLQHDYPQRTLQLSDFSIGHLDMENIKQSRDELCRKLLADIDAYFINHANEKIILNHDYPFPDKQETSTPSAMQDELLSFLLDENNKIEDIFMLPDKTMTELTLLRSSLINQLINMRRKDTVKSDERNTALFGSTAKVANDLDLLPEPNNHATIPDQQTLISTLPDITPQTIPIPGSNKATLIYQHR